MAAWTISLYVLMLAVTTALYGRISDLVGVRAPLLVGSGADVGRRARRGPRPDLPRAAGCPGAAGRRRCRRTYARRRDPLARRYSGEVRGLAFGRLAGVAAAVSCLGPLVGGLVEAVAGWRAVMALPILGALVVPFLWRALVHRRQRRAPRHRGCRARRADRVRDGAARAVTLGRAARRLARRGAARGRRAGRPPLRTSPPQRLPAGRGDPQRRRHPQRGRRLGRARVVVRDADRASGGPALRRLAGLGGRAGDGAECSGGALRAAGHRPDAHPDRAGPGARRVRGRRLRRPVGRGPGGRPGQRADPRRRHHAGDRSPSGSASRR